ncbi:MAG: alpha/beta fold hydrolase [Myxococcota bacterium]|nr:alpha/beta fold hydrolase [Myxococcota bacterium]
MPEIFRTPEARFSDWKDYPFSPNYLEWEGLRMHYVDEGAPDRPVMLLLHGMPTSSYLYRRMIPPLVEAGYRCVAPDHIGFGKSDKVLDDGWYSIERHSQACAHLIRELGLERITVACQDWGGPIGLRQAVDMPERFERLLIMNTWLHHPEHSYTDALRAWNQGWQPGNRLDEIQPCGFVLKRFMETMGAGSTPLSPDEAALAYEAPFPDRASKAGPRRFPLSLPFENPKGGNADVQERCFEVLRDWSKPVHFIWGVRDDVFVEAWGRKWAGFYPQASFDALEAGHFLQESHGPEIVEILLRRIAEE